MAGERLAFHVYASERGNLYMTEIAALLCAGLSDLGFTAELVRTGLPAATPDVANVVVAPHEYFHLLEEYPEDACLESAASCVLVNVEQPGTQWFETAFRYCQAAKHVLDINRSGLVFLQRRGLEASHLILGYHPSLDSWNGEERQARDLDVVFMGSRTPRRDRFLARNAGTWAALDCRFHLFEATKPVLQEGSHFTVGADRNRLLARTRMLLNVHQTDFPYFEWHRLVPAIANGCLVVSERSINHDPLRPFEHFVQAPLDALPAYVTSLAVDHDLRRRLAARAYEFVREELPLTKFLRQAMPVFEAARGRPSSKRRPRREAPPPPAPRVAVVASDQEEAAASDVPGVARTLARPPVADREVRQGKPPKLPALFKMVILNQQAVKRRVEALDARLAHGESSDHEIVKTPVFDDVVPDVSVVVTVYNYEQYVTECLESVVASTGVVPEILVVEDHSVDRSRDGIRAFIDAHPHLPIAAFFGRANRGLAEARNTGFRRARTECVFVLDADNLIYPDALRKLKAALDESGAAFAYGMIAQFGGTTGLFSCLPWDVHELVKRNYIDAMALIRRSAWAAVGGFRPEMGELFGNWEDYTMWLGFADLGFRGVLVPEVVALYRTHGHSSMISVANLEMFGVVDYLRRKHPALPWPAEGNA